MKRQPAIIPVDGIQELQRGVRQVKLFGEEMAPLRELVAERFDTHGEGMRLHRLAVEKSVTLQRELLDSVQRLTNVITRLIVVLERDRK